jgi:hypothetical protein
MRKGEFQCIFGSDQAVVKLKFRERISAHEEPDKVQYSVFVSYLAFLFNSPEVECAHFWTAHFRSLDCTICPLDFTFGLDCTLKITPERPG